MERRAIGEREKRRLKELRKIANTMLIEALNDPRFKRWEHLLCGVAFATFLMIFFIPKVRGEDNILTYIFFALGLITAVIFFFVFKWKAEIGESVERAFHEKHGEEYNRLLAQEKHNEKGSFDE